MGVRIGVRLLGFGLQVSGRKDESTSLGFGVSGIRALGRQDQSNAARV